MLHICRRFAAVGGKTARSECMRFANVRCFLPQMCLLAYHIGIRYGERCHVNNAAHGGAGGQNMHWPGSAEQYGTNGNAATGSGFEQVVRDVGRIHVGHDQQIGAAAQAAVGHEGSARGNVERDIAVHFAIDFQPRGALAQQF